MDENLVEMLQPGKDHSNQHLSPITLQNMHQYQLISEYLTLKPSSQTATFYNQIDNSQPSNQNQALSTSQTSQESRRDSNKPSSLHNFQKHLVTTLKKCIKIKKSSNSSHCRANIASELWEYFLRCNRPSKRTILCVLMGGSSQGRSTLNREGDEYGDMVRSFSDYSEKEINLAQEYLCREVVKQSYRLVETNGFENRRIHKPEEFKNYFIVFLKELQERKVSLRVPKNSLGRHQQASQGRQI